MVLSETDLLKLPLKSLSFDILPFNPKGKLDFPKGYFQVYKEFVYVEFIEIADALFIWPCAF